MQSGHPGCHTAADPVGPDRDSGSGAEECGKIIVRAQRRTEDPTKVRVSVFNTGSHIPEEDLDQVWDKFFKVDKARTREYGGSGVGLSIVKAIMESFHQAFGVYNTEDGVVFWFELDYAGSEREEVPAEGAAQSSAEQKKQRRAQEAAMRQEIRRRRHEKPEDEVVDAQWVVAEPRRGAERPGQGEDGPQE